MPAKGTGAATYATRRRLLTSALGGAALSLVPPLFAPALAQGTQSFRIGIANDQSGPYSTTGGPGSVAAAKLAVEEMGGKVLGRPIEILVGDHQNKPDLGATIVREWLDHGVSAIADGASSAVGVAIQNLTHERDRMFLNSGSLSSELTGKLCSPTAVQWITDTWAAAAGSVHALMETNHAVKKWFTIVVDYTAGHDIERTAIAVARQHAGEVVGTARFPLGTTDFSSPLLQARTSGAQAVLIGTAGADAINAIKQFREFGMARDMIMVSPLTVVTDLQALGHHDADGVVWVTNFYWDRDDASRQWTKRFRAARKATPTRMQASTYGAVLHYLRAVAAVGTDEGLAVAAWMRANPATDPLFGGSRIREDGRVMSPLFLMRGRAPNEVHGPEGRSEIIATLPADQAYRPLTEGGCPLIKT